jgi:hypothetical protein
MLHAERSLGKVATAPAQSGFFEVNMSNIQGYTSLKCDVATKLTRSIIKEEGLSLRLGAMGQMVFAVTGYDGVTTCNASVRIFLWVVVV